jgi:hypothetical protein
MEYVSGGIAAANSAALRAIASVEVEAFAGSLLSSDTPKKTLKTSSI